jgi:PleD family two-component response regulator
MFEKSLLRQDTGLYTYPAFLYFMEKEFVRFERFSQPFAIILIEIGVRSPQNIQIIDPLPLKGVREVARRIDKLKRKTDMLGHYETFGLGLLLPWTDGTSARSFASRLSDVILSPPLDPEIDSNSIVLKIGSGCVPEVGQDLNLLLSSARPSKA